MDEHHVEKVDLQLLSDDSIRGAAQDLLGRKSFGERIVSVLDVVKSQSPSSVLGLIGPWGSGKTSVLNLVVSERKARGGWEVVVFNPWELSDIDSLLRSFFLAIIAALPEDALGKEWRGKIARYAHAVSPFGSVLNVPGIDVGKALEVLSGTLAQDQSIAAKRREVEEALEKFARPILIVLDDVDRLMPDELLLVFKLVRLVGRLPGVYYLIAFDEETMLDVVSKSVVVGESRERALAYLEKIVQIRLDLPPLHASDAVALVDSALRLVLESNQLTVEDDELSRFTLAYNKCLGRRLDSPRSIKRYFGQIEAYLPLVLGEVNVIDFMILTFFRTFYPRLYGDIQKRKGQLTKTPTISFGFSPSRTPDERRAYWRGVLRAGQVRDEDISEFMDVLGDLFPEIKEALQGSRLPDSAYSQLARQKRAGSGDYFDRYFQFSVPRGDIPDSLINEAVLELRAGNTGPVINRLVASVPSSGMLLLDKLQAIGPDLSPDDKALMFDFLASIYADLPEGALLTGAPHIYAEALGGELIRDISERNVAAVDELFQRAAKHPRGLLLVVKGAERALADRTEQGKDLTPALSHLKETVRGMIEQSLEASTSRRIPETEDSLRLLFAWARLTTPQTVRDWVRAQLGTTAWTLRDLAGMFVPIATAYMATGVRKVLGEFQQSDFEALVPIDEAFASLGSLDEVAGNLRESRSSDTSFENRVNRALLTLKRLRDNQERASDPA